MLKSRTLILGLIGVSFVVAAIWVVRSQAEFLAPIEREAEEALAANDPLLLARVAERYALSGDSGERAFAQLFQAYAEYMYMRRAGVTHDERGAYLHIEMVKPRISSAAALVSDQGVRSRLEKWAARAIKEIEAFENDRLLQVRSDLQKGAQ